MKKRIVIWGDDHHNALGLLRMLGGRGFDILFLVNRVNHHIATTSKYCSNYVIVQNIDDGLAYLFNNYTDKNNKAVLLFTADKYSEAANRNFERLSDFFFVSGPNQEGILEYIDDKFTMSKLAVDVGITIPETVLIPSQTIYDVKHFPAIIKPCNPTAKEFKTLIVNNEKQLIKASKSFIHNKRYVIQTLIHKEADGLIYGCRTWDGVTHLSGICVRNRWSDDGCGSFGYITDNIPSCINKDGIRLFLDKIDFRGLFSVEYALTNEGAYFYEFNLRNDGTSVLFYNAGSNMALCFVNSCFGIREDVSLKVQGKQYLMHEIFDEFNIYDGVVSRQQWLEDKKKTTLYFLYDPEDMLPYESQFAQKKKMFIHHIVAKSWINKIRLRLLNNYRNKK